MAAAGVMTRRRASAAGVTLGGEQTRAAAPAGARASNPATAADNSQGADVYEWLCVGAGITGVYWLASFTEEERASVLLIEQQDSVGGLWAWIPRWQTVQNDPLDFCTEGFTTRKPVWTADDVCHLLEQKVRLQGLAPYMRLGHRLDAYRWCDDEQLWVCRATRLADGAALDFKARRIALATGKHAVPNVPDIPTDGSVKILHSSQVDEFERVARNKRVAVVGAGASGLDLCVHSIEHGAAGPVHWVVRKPMHFSGVAINALWPMIAMQLLLGGRAASWLLNVIVNLVVYARHLFAGTLGWLPREWFNINRRQLVPGRGLLLRHKGRLLRHEGCTIEFVEGGLLHLSNGETAGPVDVLLLGTGYTTPPRPKGFVEPTAYAGLLSTGDLRGRLYVLGEKLLDTTGATPFVAYQLYGPWLRRVAAADDPRLRAARRWPGDARRLLNGVEIAEALAPFDRREFPRFTWRLRALVYYLYYRFAHRTTAFDPQRVLGTGLNLDAMPRAPLKSVAAGGGAGGAAAVRRDSSSSSSISASASGSGSDSP